VPKIRLLLEPSRRIRWITRDEVERLLLELPEHLKAMVRFSLETGYGKPMLPACNGHRLI
jgi:hypothetical protein